MVKSGVEGDAAPENGYVGYGCPPKEHQFRRGGKGNPWGRKGKPKPKLDFLEERLRVRIDGRWQWITRDEAIDHALYKEAMAGNVSAVRQLEVRRARRLAQTVGERDEAVAEADQAALDRYVGRIEGRGQGAEPAAASMPPDEDGPEPGR